MYLFFHFISTGSYVQSSLLQGKLFPITRQQTNHSDPEQYRKLEIWGVCFSTIIPGLVDAIQIQVINTFYGQLAINLTDVENHRTDTEYEEYLIAKTFMFQFVNSYASLVFIAFIKECIGKS
ncbi:unnamed protein product [Ascophyllum nodosum]